MGWTDEFLGDTRQLLASTGLPRPVLRHLLLSHGVGIGSRVLDVGCGRGELARAFSALGVDVIGLTDDAQAVDAVRRDSGVDVRLLKDATVPFAGHVFDLVLLRDCRRWQVRSPEPDVIHLTAELLSALRPGGHLVALAPPSQDDASVESIDRVLELFPGERTRQQVPVRGFGLWSRWLGGRSASYRTTSLRIPSEPADREAWRCLAQVAVENGLHDAVTPEASVRKAA